MPHVKELLETLEYGPAPEGEELAIRWLEDHSRRFGHFVGGEWTEYDDAGSMSVQNPSRNAELARMSVASPEVVDTAVAAARKALPAWGKLGGTGRARILYALARQIQKHSRLFAVLESLDNGKPLRETRDLDIPLVARHFYHHAGWARLLESHAPGYGPVGVVGQIIPWNFPLLMCAWKVAPALATGNTVVLKPAEFTPLTALLFGELCARVGVPAGVVNILTGGGETGAALAGHPDVDKVAFTGSTEVGRILRRQTAGSGKRLTLELGGKSPFLIFDDADLDSAVEGVVDAIWFNQGQVCCAGSRILVQEGMEETLIARLRRRMENLRMGDPLDKGVDMGAIVAPVQLERIRSLVEQGEAEGAQIWQPSWAVPAKGCFYPPTLCTGVSPASLLAQVEIFGPVVTVLTFRTPDEAVELANNTRYGLAASIWSENINLALDIAPRIHAGTVWVNCTNLFDAASGFGGVRESGFGREGGEEGLWEYLRPVKAPAPVAWLRERRKKQGNVSADEGRDAEGTAPTGLAPFPIPGEDSGSGSAALDRTAKLYIGGKQVRPDGGYSLVVTDPKGHPISEVPRGNRKDIRNGVEAARKAQGGWGATAAHTRAQILYYLAENLEARSGEFQARLREVVGASRKDARAEVEAAVERLFVYGGWADKWEGRVHPTPFRNVTLALPEPVGVLGLIAPPERPLLAAISLLAPALSMGNTAVLVPSEPAPLLATDLYQILDTSDVPGGVVNIVTGGSRELAGVLALHDDVDGVWAFGSAELAREVEAQSAGNLKRTWVNYGIPMAWDDPQVAQGPAFLRHATRIKNIWVPYGA
ncbi:MAG: aldehyde dehydrogenase family protein [Gemmatimonadota bacterium]